MTYQNSQYKGGFELKLYFEPEYMQLDELLPDETPEQLQELYDKIKRYELQYFCARVTACKNGIELHSEYLGGCIYEGETDFMNGVYYADMCAAAIEGAKQAIKELVK